MRKQITPKQTGLFAMMADARPEESSTANQPLKQEKDHPAVVSVHAKSDSLSNYAPMQALHTFVRGFSVAFALREGITVTLRLIEILRKHGVLKVFSFDRLLEQSLTDRVQAVRYASPLRFATSG